MLPSLRLGGSNPSQPYFAKPSAWRSQQPQPLLVLRRGFNPPPIPRPLQGGGSTAPPRRSFIKVLLPKIGRREIPYATELRLFVFAPLTKFISNIVQAESRGKTSFHYAEAPPMLIMRSMINLKS